MKLKIYIVDAFTSTRFQGNPGAVVPLTQPLDDAVMQKVATEMNLSETGFVRPLEGDGNDTWHTCSLYSLRWFTPKQEIPLCGHDTLATAHVIFHHLGHRGDKIQFQTLSGILEVGRDGDDGVMIFPSNIPTPLTEAEQKELSQVVKWATSGLKVHQVLISHTLKYLLIHLDDSHTRSDLESLKPDFGAMERSHDGSKVKGVIVSVVGDGDPYHVFSRFFAPWYGVNEDPVTGSAHTVLGPYWAEKLAREDLYFRQCGRRGGDVKVRIRDDGRIDLIGPSVTVLEGHLSI